MLPTLSLPEYANFLVAFVLPGYGICWVIYYIFGWKEWENLKQLEQFVVALSFGAVSSYLGDYLYWKMFNVNVDLASVELSELSVFGLINVIFFFSILGYSYSFKTKRIFIRNILRVMTSITLTIFFYYPSVYVNFYYPQLEDILYKIQFLSWGILIFYPTIRRIGLKLKKGISSCISRFKQFLKSRFSWNL